MLKDQNSQPTKRTSFTMVQGLRLQKPQQKQAKPLPIFGGYTKERTSLGIRQDIIIGG